MCVYECVCDYDDDDDAFLFVLADETTSVFVCVCNGDRLADTIYMDLLTE